MLRAADRKNVSFLNYSNKYLNFFAFYYVRRGENLVWVCWWHIWEATDGQLLV